MSTISMRRVPAGLALLAATTALLLVGCSSSDESSSPTTTASTAAAGGSELEEGLAEAGLERKGDALVSAMKAERYEIEGNVIHVYVGADSAVPKGTECIVVTGILSDGEVAVIHDGDEETTCGEDGTAVVELGEATEPPEIANEELADYARKCFEGDFVACDETYFRAEGDEAAKEYGLTCGDRVPEPQFGECAVLAP